MAKTENFTLDQGSSLKIKLVIIDNSNSKVDITDYTIKGKIKRTYNSSEFIEFSINVLDATNGIVELSLTGIQTGSLLVGRYVYDIETMHTNSNNEVIIERIVEGHITIAPSVTKIYTDLL